MATVMDSLNGPFPHGRKVMVRFGPNTVAASKTNAIVERYVMPWPGIVRGVRYNAYSALSSGTLTFSASGTRIKVPNVVSYQTALTLFSGRPLSAIAHSATAAFTPIYAEPIASATGAVIGQGDVVTCYVTTPASSQKTGFLAVLEIEPAHR